MLALKAELDCSLLFHHSQKNTMPQVHVTDYLKKGDVLEFFAVFTLWERIAKKKNELLDTSLSACDTNGNKNKRDGVSLCCAATEVQAA